MNLTRNGKWGIAAVMAVALVAAGAALAATKIHTGGTANAGRLPGYGVNRPPGAPGGDLRTAAAYLGTDVSTLARELRNGKTLAQIANATAGKSASGLIDALVAAAKSRFGGDTSGLKEHITAMVNGTGPRVRPPDRDGDHHDDDEDERGDDDGTAPAPKTTVPPTHI